MCFSDFNEKVVHHFLYVAWLFFIINNWRQALVIKAIKFSVQYGFDLKSPKLKWLKSNFKCLIYLSATGRHIYIKAGICFLEFMICINTTFTAPFTEVLWTPNNWV